MIKKKSLVVILSLGLYSLNGHAMNLGDQKQDKENGQNKFFQEKQAKEKVEFDALINLINSHEDPLTDAQIEHVRSKLGADLTRKIFRHNIHRNEMLAYVYRESLLAAVVMNSPNHTRELRQRCTNHYNQFKSQNIVNPHQKRIVLSVAKRGVPNAVLNPLNNLQDATPDQLLGHSLYKSEFAIVGWSDGKTQIILNDSDRRNLNNLSEEQILFLDSLHSRQSHQLSYKEYRIFSSLPRDMQNNLKSNYTIYCPWWKTPAAPIAAGIIALGLYAMGAENRQLLGLSISKGAGASKDLAINSVSWTWDWTKYLVTTPIKFGLTYTVGVGLSLLSKAASKASSWTTWDIG